MGIAVGIYPYLAIMSIPVFSFFRKAFQTNRPSTLHRLIQSAAGLVLAGGSINGLLAFASGRGLPGGRRLFVRGGLFPALSALFFPLKAQF